MMNLLENPHQRHRTMKTQRAAQVVRKNNQQKPPGIIPRMVSFFIFSRKANSLKNTHSTVAYEIPEDLPPKEDASEWWMKMVPDEELNNLHNSPKLLILFELLRECAEIGDKILVFSQSLQSLDVIEHFLSMIDQKTQGEDIDGNVGEFRGSWQPNVDYFRLDGSRSVDNREAMCKVFNDKNNLRARLFLISTRAGGLGINLVAANRVVIFDVSWNPSHDTQSIFRVYRFGQDKPCYIYRLLAMVGFTLFFLFILFTNFSVLLGHNGTKGLRTTSN